MMQAVWQVWDWGNRSFFHYQSPNPDGLCEEQNRVVAQFGCATLGDGRALHTVPEGHRF